jgi:hypothetical protein
MHNGRKTRAELCEDLVIEKMLEIATLKKELVDMHRKYQNACEHISNLESHIENLEEERTAHERR